MISALSKSLRKNLETKLQKPFQKKLQKTLKDTGLSLRATDLAAFIEEKAPKSSRAALGYALDLFRPFTAGMGLRITRMSDNKIEIVIPDRTRNASQNERVHEGAIVTASLEAARLLWLRHVPHGNFAIELKELNFHVLQDFRGSLRVRLELPELQRETTLMQLRSHHTAAPNVTVAVFDAKEKNIAKLDMTLKLTNIPALAEP